MDWVFIDQLEIDTIIGIHAFEQTVPQALRLSVRLGFDNRIPAASDAIDDTLDYAKISRRLRSHVQGQRWWLIETLIESCAVLLRDEFGARRLRLRIDKPDAVPEARSVGVIIERDYSAVMADV